MKKYYLDKIIDQGTLYRAETDKAYVVTAIGTDSSTKATLYVGGVPVAEIYNEMAPNYPINTNLNGPIALGNLFIVIPPAKTFSFSGSSGSTMRLIGNIIELGPGEALTPDLLARFSEQGKKFISYLSGSVTTAAGGVVSAGSEVDVIVTTVPVSERYTINRLYMAEGRLDDYTAVPQFWSRIYVNGKPLDNLETAMGKFGIAGSAAPHPAREAVNFEAFSFEEKPLVLEEGTDLRITIINNGADYTVPTGRTLYRIATVAIEREIL
jgi:hypothetical protein